MAKRYDFHDKCYDFSLIEIAIIQQSRLITLSRKNYIYILTPGEVDGIYILFVLLVWNVMTNGMIML